MREKNPNYRIKMLDLCVCVCMRMCSMIAPRVLLPTVERTSKREPKIFSRCVYALIMYIYFIVCVCHTFDSKYYDFYKSIKCTLTHSLNHTKKNTPVCYSKMFADHFLVQ